MLTESQRKRLQRRIAYYEKRLANGPWLYYGINYGIRAFLIACILSVTKAFYPPVFIAALLASSGVMYANWQDIPRKLEELKLHLIKELPLSQNAGIYSPSLTWKSPIVIFLILAALSYGVGLYLLPYPVWQKVIYSNFKNQPLHIDIADESGAVSLHYVFPLTYMARQGSKADFWLAPNAHFISIFTLEALYPSLKPWHGDLTEAESAAREPLINMARIDRMSVENEDPAMVTLRFITMPDLKRDALWQDMLQHQFQHNTPTITQEHDREVWHSNISMFIPNFNPAARTQGDVIYLVPSTAENAIEPIVCIRRECSYYQRIEGDVYIIAAFDINQLSNWHTIADNIKILLNQAQQTQVVN